MKRSTIIWLAMATLLLGSSAYAYTRLKFKWHGGSLHVATVKHYHNGTDTTYFLEIPLRFTHNP